MNTVAARIFALGAIAALGAAGALGAACSRSGGEKVNTTSQALDAGAPHTITVNANNPSAVFTGEFLVVSFTDWAGGTHARVGWAYANASGAFWTVCNAAIPAAGCNNPNPVPMIAGQTGWVGKGALSTDGRGGVVYVTLANDTGHGTGGLVVALLSTNHGVSFDQAFQVNAPGGECDPGDEDLPDVTFDYTTAPPTAWFAWRHKGASSYGGCVRRAMVKDGTLTFLDGSRTIENMDREHDDINLGQGGLRVQAGDGALTVAYSNSDALHACPSKAPLKVSWGTVTSFNQGIDWTDHSVIYTTTKFQSCLRQAPGPAHIQNGLRAFDFLRTPDGTYYAAINDSQQTVRVFMSTASGLALDVERRTWSEYCLRSPTSNVDGGPTASWTAPLSSCAKPFVSAPFAAMFPTLAADGLNRVSVLYYEGVSPTDFHAAIKGNVAPRSANEAWLPIKAPVILPDDFAPDGGLLLEHEATVATVPPPIAQSCTRPGSFFPVWVTVDPVQNASRLVAARFSF